MATLKKAPYNLIAMSNRIRNDGLSFLLELRDYGEFVRTSNVPGLRNYLVFSPKMAYDILIKNPTQYQKPALAKRLFKSSFGNGIFFSEGDFWRRQRKLAQPAFHHVRINAYAEQIVADTLAMLNNWQEGATIEIDKVMHALTLIIVIKALFKDDISNKTDQIGKAMQLLGEATGSQITSILEAMIPSWVPTPLKSLKAFAVKQIDTIIYQMIADHRQRGEDKGDLLSMFIEARTEDTNEGMSDLQIRDELMTMFIAGHETSAQALTWAFIELTRQPEIAAKLRAEVTSVLGQRPPTLDDLPKLVYTQQVIKEVLRLYPPAVFISRSPLVPMEMGGATIHKNDLVNIVLYVIHRDSRWYDNPEQFKPDRWEGDFEKNLPKCVYMPFGNGPRVCIGNGFAMMEMQLVLATIIQRWTFTMAEESAQVKPKFGITISADRPVLMTLGK